MICTNCGVAYPLGACPSATCPICEDERVTNPLEQTWVSAQTLAATHRCSITPCEPGLASIGVTPSFGIGQRAMLVERSDGCILWDCVSMVDQTAIDYIVARGGLKAIAVSHPHFYGAMGAWSDAFGGVPIYVHQADREWVVNPHPAIEYWSGDTREIAPGVTLVCCGGHFDGGSVMHVAGAAAGRGALLTGDTIMVNQYNHDVSFMRSYPTHVPLTQAQMRHIAAVTEPFAFSSLYGPWLDRMIAEDGAALVARTAQRYLDLVM
jgi:hypothetical protein